MLKDYEKYFQKLEIECLTYEEEMQGSDVGGVIALHYSDDVKLQHLGMGMYAYVRKIANGRELWLTVIDGDEVPANWHDKSLLTLYWGEDLNYFEVLHEGEDARTCLQTMVNFEGV